MKTALRICLWTAVLAVLSFLLTGCAPTPAPAPDTRAADEKAIAAADAASLKAIADKDVEKIMAGWADDGVAMDPDRPIAVGKDAVRKGWQDLLAMPEVKLNWTTTQTVVARSGDVAYAYGPYEMSFKDAKGKLVQDKGKYLTTWRKQADGSWKVSADIYNSDGPPPQAEKK